jgi:cell division septum initiation protein DivIVA
VSTPRLSRETRQLLGALADRVEELEDERARIRQRLAVLRTALARLVDDEYQPPSAHHVASVIGDQIAQLLDQDAELDHVRSSRRSRP